MKKQSKVHIHDFHYREGDKPGRLTCTICGKRIIVSPAGLCAPLRQP